MRLVLVALLCGMMISHLSLGAEQDTEFKRPVDRFAYAQGLKRGAIWDFAEKAFEEFIRLYPKHELVASAWSELIDCLRRQEKHDEMLSRIVEFKKRWPKDKNVDLFTYWEGISHYQRRRFPDASRSFEGLLKSKNAYLRECGTYLLADCVLRGKDGVARGYELLAQVGALPLRKDRPYRESAAFALGRYYQHQLKFDEALSWFSRLCDYGDGNKQLREEAMYLVGEIHYSRNEYALACKAYDRFLVVFNGGRWSSEVRKRRAQATFMQERFDEALKQVLEWRKLHVGVEDYEMDCLHGRCLYQLGEYAAAHSHFAVVVANVDAPVGMRRFCLVQGIFCLLNDDKRASWERGLEGCVQYFKSYRDLKYEPLVQRYEALLLEKLGRYQEAVASFGKALQKAGKTDLVQRRNLKLHQVQCLVKLQDWKRGAVLLREIAEGAEHTLKAGRLSYLLWAGDLELKADKASALAEADFLKALTFKEITAEMRKACWEQLLGIYVIRKDSVKTHEVLGKLIDTATGDVQEQYQYRDALVLIELGRPREAIVRLREALSKAVFKDSSREVSMRLTLLGLLQKELNGGADVSGEMIEHYRRLAVKPESMTARYLTPAILYQMSLLVSARYGATHSPADRQLLERTYQRAVSGGFKDAPAFFAGYRLGMLYMESGDGRYGQAEKVLRGMTDALLGVMKKEPRDEDLLNQLDQGDNLLRESLSLLAECYYELKRDAEALSVADQVLQRGLNYGAAKRCLLVQARIYYYREPRQLEKALEKLGRYQYTLGGGPGEPGDEEEVMVLLVNVQRELKRDEGALMAYRQLKVRYPKRAAREPWAKEYELRRSGK